jgi:hypothetical protein
VCVVCVGVPVICLWYTPNSTNLNKRWWFANQLKTWNSNLYTSI